MYQQFNRGAHMENTILSSHWAKINDNEFTVNARILARQDNLGNVLASSADVTETKVHCGEGEFRLSGRINVKILCEDEEGKPLSLNYNVDYDEKFTDNNVKPDSRLGAEVTAEEMNVNLLGGREAEITVRCGVSGEIRLDNRTQTDLPEENLIMKKEHCLIGRIKADLSEEFVVIHEMPVLAGETLLQTDAKAVLGGVSVKDEVMTVSGKIYFQTVYSSEEGLPKVNLTAVPFSHESQAKDFADGTALVRLKVTDTRVRIIEEENGVFLNAEFTLKLTAVSFEYTTWNA